MSIALAMLVKKLLNAGAISLGLFNCNIRNIVEFIVFDIYNRPYTRPKHCHIIFMFSKIMVEITDLTCSYFTYHLVTEFLIMKLFKLRAN